MEVGGEGSLGEGSQTSVHSRFRVRTLEESSEGLIWEDILIPDLLRPFRLNNLFLSA